PTASPIRFQACDAETLRFPAGQHLIVSCSAVQWFERPERFLSGCRELLTTGGYLAFSTFGPQNVREVASLTSETLPYRSLEELRRTLSGVYQIVYSREEILHFTFPSPLDVLKHLQATGVTGLRSRKWTKGQLEDFCQRYHRQYAAQDGTVPLTYHPIYMICKKQGK
ncbi:MAG: methyltransferase domain-containing protein, partial [Paraprevotella clara]|nr:methyltransferase domain-containing protein [Paraprevotella clara]